MGIVWQGWLVDINLQQKNQSMNNHEKSIVFSFVPDGGLDGDGPIARVDRRTASRGL